MPCVVSNCQETKFRILTVFGLPSHVRKSQPLLDSWNSALGKDCTQKDFKICQIHFEDKHILRTQSGRARLHPKAIPCLNLQIKEDIVSEEDSGEKETERVIQEFVNIEILKDFEDFIEVEEEEEESYEDISASEDENLEVLEIVEESFSDNSDEDYIPEDNSEDVDETWDLNLTKRNRRHCKVCLKNEGIFLFVIPKPVRNDKIILKTWEDALKMECSAENFRICSDHFEERHILKPIRGRWRLHPKAFPHLKKAGCHNEKSIKNLTQMETIPMKKSEPMKTSEESNINIQSNEKVREAELSCKVEFTISKTSGSDKVVIQRIKDNKIVELKQQINCYKRCHVPQCSPRKNVSVFVVPEAVRKSETLLKTWNNLLLIDCSLKGTFICQDHFQDKHILRPIRKSRLRLHPNAFPSRNLPVPDL
ncbi:hypothetical protein ACFFRR_007704 [Megaselia abdita]